MLFSSRSCEARVELCVNHPGCGMVTVLGVVCLCDQNVGSRAVDAVAELLTARHHCDDWE